MTFVFVDIPVMIASGAIFLALLLFSLQVSTFQKKGKKYINKKRFQQSLVLALLLLIPHYYFFCELLFPKLEGPDSMGIIGFFFLLVLYTAVLFCVPTYQVWANETKNPEKSAIHTLFLINIISLLIVLITAAFVVIKFGLL